MNNNTDKTDLLIMAKQIELELKRRAGEQLTPEENTFLQNHPTIDMSRIRLIRGMSCLELEQSVSH